MPLCTTATRSLACGCALVSFGLPWVAQRVWPMPVVPVSGCCSSRRSRFLSLPSARRARQVPSFQRRNAGRIIAAIFQPLERIDQLTGDRLMAKDSNNAAH